MKILIYGSQGTLGTALQEDFHSHGYEVVGLASKDFDITNSEHLEKSLEMFQPDIIINAAAINNTDGIETDDELYEKALEVNGYAPGKIAQLAKQYNKVFVHYSTDYIFDGKNKNGYSEDAAPYPLSRYAQTKLLGEQEVQKNGEKYYIIRVSRLFGKKGKSENAKRSFVDTMIYLATEAGKTELSVVSDQVSAPTYAPDAAEFTRKILEQNKPYGIYHGANEGSCSWQQWAKKIFEIKGISIPVHPVLHTDFPRPTQVPACSTLINTKMEKMRPWEEALDEYLK